VISNELARRLHDAGVGWEPASGDQFMIPGRDMDDDVFAVSDMVVEVHELTNGRLLGFNGTTEWALDSIEQQDVLWLPREEQLRELLGGAFVALQGTPGGFVAVIERDGQQERHIDIDASCAYARALLSLLT
jgi:hypothetical protein